MDTHQVLRVSVLEDAHLQTPSRKWVEISVRRTFTASDPPLSGCCLLPQPSELGDMTKFILASSWDNTIYRYTRVCISNTVQCSIHWTSYSNLMHDVKFYLQLLNSKRVRRWQTSCT